MKNVYDGIATLDGSGEALVTVPDFVTQINQNFRYQLTPIGSAMPNLYIGDELAGTTFRIAGGTPNGRVSWQITGIRSDNWATQNPIQLSAPMPTRPIAQAQSGP